MGNGVVEVKNTADIQPYNHEENVEAIKEDIQYIRSTNAEYAVKIGQRLILAKENTQHGSWLETLDEIGFTSPTALRLMKIAETFGENPSLLEGMTKQKAFLMTSLPDENLVQLKEDEVFISSDGTAYSLGEVREMTSKKLQNELVNLRNQKNKEISNWKDKAINAQDEMTGMRKEDEQREQEHKAFLRGKDEAFAEILEERERRIKELMAEKEALFMKNRSLEGRMYKKSETVEAIEDAKQAVDAAIIHFNMLGEPDEPGGNNDVCKVMLELIDYGKNITQLMKKSENNTYFDDK